jgi:leucyl-tRNA synthetase
MGLRVKAPLCQHSAIYSLPLPTISSEKGTGVVASVPSDCPTDFAALRDLKNTPTLREQYGITEEMVKFDAIPVINVPSLSTTSAVTAVEEMKISSQNAYAKL